jgi:predicted RNase H-like HicB family nuclease
MNFSRPLGAIAVAAALAAIQMPALADQGKTREQVRAELADAVRTGDIVAGEFGLKLNEVTPGRYPAMAQAGKTRDEVRAELAEAVRTGDIVTGEFGFKRNEIAPSLYPSRMASSAGAQFETAGMEVTPVFDGRNVAWGK